jgi:hypothetical protein
MPSLGDIKVLSPAAPSLPPLWRPLRSGGRGSTTDRRVETQEQRRWVEQSSRRLGAGGGGRASSSSPAARSGFELPQAARSSSGALFSLYARSTGDDTGAGAELVGAGASGGGRASSSSPGSEVRLRAPPRRQGTPPVLCVPSFSFPWMARAEDVVGLS